MKKLLLIAATSTALLSSFAVLACDGCGTEPKVVPLATVTTVTTENQIYGKIEGGGAFFNPLKVKDPEGTELKYKNKTTGIFGVGIGYYLADNFRMEAMFHKPIDPVFKQTFEGKNDEGENVKINYKIKGPVMSALLNGYVDLFDLGGGKIFAGGGIGWAQLKPKITGRDNDKEEDLSTFKKTNNFAYQLTLGTSMDLSDTVKGEISYSFRDYGKVKKNKGREEDKESRMEIPNYRSHNVMVGLRFGF